MASAPGDKDPGAFRTIGELSRELGVAQHILRYWESKFPQLRPLQRAGNRRYYRPADVELVRQINRLLGQEGYTVRGVQKLLATGATDSMPQPDTQDRPISFATAPVPPSDAPRPSIDVERLRALRELLVSALQD